MKSKAEREAQYEKNKAEREAQYKERKEKEEMERQERETIGSAVQRGNTVWVYDIRGHMLFSRQGILQGFTGQTVSIKSGKGVTTYNARGSILFSR